MWVRILVPRHRQSTIDKGHAGVGPGAGRIEIDRAAVRGDGSVELPIIGKRVTEIIVRVGEAWREFDGPTIRRDRFGQSAGAFQCLTEVKLVLGD